MVGVLNEVRQSGAHATNCLVGDFYTVRKLLSVGSILHVHVKEEEWEVVYREISDGKESGNHFCGQPLEIEVYVKNVRSGF